MGLAERQSNKMYRRERIQRWLDGIASLLFPLAPGHSDVTGYKPSQVGALFTGESPRRLGRGQGHTRQRKTRT